MSPLAKKLLIKPHTNWLFINAPEDYLAYVEPLPDGVTTSFEAIGKADGVQLFVSDSKALHEALQLVQPVLKPDTILWIAYPKKSSGITTDLTMMGNWEVLKPFNLETVAAASINDTWTGIRLKPTGTSKVSPTRASEVKQNEFGEYIDIDNKQITLPPDIAQAFVHTTPSAAEFYENLSWSNKKEYVLWVLSAKQEKTRQARVEQMVEKLLNKKKNPSEK